jgi:thiol peroxidase
MATTHFKGAPVSTSGALPVVGSKLPDFALVRADLGTATLADYAGKKLVLNIFPSIDTGICAMSVRAFNAKAGGLENTVVLCISKDLPFAAKRFCGAEGLDKVVTASTFRDDGFEKAYGLRLVGSPLAGLLARAVIVADADGVVRHVELVNEITTEPDYDAALAAL